MKKIIFLLLCCGMLIGTTDMQKRASDIVENFVEDMFGKELNLI